jgi:hypothetical protein
MRRLLAFLLMLAPLALAAADVSGKWAGAMDIKGPDGSVNSTPVTAEFKQTGATVTGAAGVAGQDQFALEKGTLDGNQLTFEVHAPDGVYAVKATLTGDTQLKGEVAFTSPEGAKVTASLTMTRN